MKMLTALLGAFFATSPVSAAIGAEEQTLVLYSELGEPTRLDVEPTGLSVGDIISRRGTKQSSPGGEVIADYFSQAIITLYEPESQRSVRSYFIETIFEEGSIYMMDLVEMDHREAPLDSHVHEGAIVGGTGKYSGIRGSYQLTIEDGQTVKTLTYRLPEG